MIIYRFLELREEDAVPCTKALDLLVHRRIEIIYTADRLYKDAVT